MVVVYVVVFPVCLFVLFLNAGYVCLLFGLWFVKIKYNNLFKKENIRE